ncbi:tetratricopeptide repeat protein [Nocardioides sp. InS609-2]|uniref:tetratricopeptide repeat protein n=1 Tax=Nocardioides sp. InS609-2 TaxID=2760705 RepID=UPI0020BF5610|nr:tetratricopeptide repeat protein [Nocardioides sp. InS609-2]
MTTSTPGSTPPALLGNVAVIHFHLGDHDESAAHHSRAWREAVREGDRSTAAVAMNNLGEVHLLRQDAEGAVEAAREPIAMATQIGAAGTANTRTPPSATR